MTAVNPDVPGDCTYAPDVARAVRLLLEAPRARCLQHRLRRPGLVREYCSPMRAKWRQGLPSRSRRRQTSSSTRIEAPKHGAPMISPARRGISDGGRGPSPWPTISSGSASKRNQGNEIQVNGRAHLGLKRHRCVPAGEFLAQFDEAPVFDASRQVDGEVSDEACFGRAAFPQAGWSSWRWTSRTQWRLSSTPQWRAQPRPPAARSGRWRRCKSAFRSASGQTVRRQIGRE
jgi:hypothetical protein